MSIDISFCLLVLDTELGTGLEQLPTDAQPHYYLLAAKMWSPWQNPVDLCRSNSIHIPGELWVGVDAVQSLPSGHTSKPLHPDICDPPRRCSSQWPTDEAFYSRKLKGDCHCPRLKVKVQINLGNVHGVWRWPTRSLLTKFWAKKVV